MSKSYSDRIENMDDEARKELDSRIRSYAETHKWQKTISKYRCSPMQLRAILAGKDAMKAKPKVAKAEKTKAKTAKKAKSAKKTAKKAAKKTAKKAAKKAKAANKANKAKTAKKTAKKAAKKTAAKKGKRASAQGGGLVIEGSISAERFVKMVLKHSERMATALRA